LAHRVALRGFIQGQLGRAVGLPPAATWITATNTEEAQACDEE